MRWLFRRRKGPEDKSSGDPHAAGLRRRCQVFVDKQPPPEVEYVPGSISERWMRHFAAGGAFDAEMIELLGLCIIEASDAEEQMKTPEAKRYFRESGQLLRSIWGVVVQ